jgi:nifR3 family TIM-barrel protein
LQTGKIAEQAGCSAVALHARTAAQLYDGQARWDAIGELKRSLTIPVLGNGDIWEAHDALRMMRHTGCDGVVVGRGCLGRPWLFRDLAAVFAGQEPPDPPNLGEVAQIMLRHARLLAAWFGEDHAVRAFRRHTSWYTKGFRGSASFRHAFMQIKSLSELESIAGQMDPELPFPPDAMRVPRGKSSGTQVVSLPDGYLDALGDATPPEEHEGEGALDGG